MAKAKTATTPGEIVASLGYQYQNISIAVPGTGTGLEAFADTGQFVVTAGYAKVNSVEVPQRKGIAVFAGFDPITATFPIILNNFGGDKKAFDTEEGCQLIEWMAGQGHGPGGSFTSAAEEGKEPSRITVESSSGGELTHLIPANYNSFGSIEPTPEWLITGLEWGASIRSEIFPFQRLRQRVTITLTEYKEPAGITSSTVASSNLEWKKHKVGNGRSKSHTGESPLELVQYVAKWPGNVAPILAKELLARWNKKHKGKLKIPHTNSKFPVGTEVEVPFKKK